MATGILKQSHNTKNKVKVHVVALIKQPIKPIMYHFIWKSWEESP